MDRITLLYPVGDEVVTLLPEGHRRLLAGEDVDARDVGPLDWRNIRLDGTERSFPIAVTPRWQGGGEIEWSFFRDFRDAKRGAMENLLAGARYYWRVAGTQSPVGSFLTEDRAPRLLRVDGLTNVRDLGGWRTADGRRVRQGLIYRGSEMNCHHRLTEEGRRTLLRDLGIATDLDLREEAVDTITESPMGRETEWLLIPCRAYEGFFDPQEAEVCRKLFDVICDAGKYPIYMHCWGGADRTGTLSLLIHALLGVDDASLMADYEMTSFSIWGKRSRNSGVFHALLWALKQYGTDEEPLRVKAARFAEERGIDVMKLRANLLEEAERKEGNG